MQIGKMLTIIEKANYKMITIKQTIDITSPIYHDALAIRETVFIDEQHVPRELEIDDDEARATNLVLYVDDAPAATLRLLPIAADTIKLQRMAVRKAYRQRGYGRALIAEAEGIAETNGYQQITLGGQLTARGFYETLGYTACGEEFMDAGIRHIEMVKTLTRE